MVLNLIVFLGPPGSGKGTQAQMLSQKHGFLHISTGDLLRDAIAAQSPLGKQIKSIVDQGQLVPDELVSSLVFEKLNGLPKKQGVILDGYPRTAEQAKSLDAFGNKSGWTVDSVLSFDVKAQELIQRLSSRRQCPNCKEVYNLLSKAPKKADTCDKCGTALIQRKDDKKEVIEERLNVYTRQTEPVLKHYQGHAGFRAIDAARPMEKVFDSVLDGLKVKA